MSNKSKKGIALISILLILVILVMFISAFGTIVTGSQTFAANNAARIMLGQVAEAGIAYVTYKLNEDPAWAESGEHTLPDLKGKFYITFNPDEDYYSINNLTKIISKTRITKPEGTVVPPYTAEIIIKAIIMDDNNRSRLSKYYTVQLVRGDFFDKHVSSEGPILIQGPKLYMDPGTHDKGGIIQSNYADDNTPSISFISNNTMTVTMGRYSSDSTEQIKGSISTPGKIKKDDTVTFDRDYTLDIEGSNKLPQGYIDIKDMIARGTGGSSSIETLAPGIYTIKRTPNHDDNTDPSRVTSYTYNMTYPDGSTHESDTWFNIDENSGDLVITKDIQVNPEGSVNNFNIEFTYNDRRGQDDSVVTDIASNEFPSIPVIEGDEVNATTRNGRVGGEDDGTVRGNQTGGGLSGEYVSSKRGMTHIKEEKPLSYTKPLIVLNQSEDLTPITGIGGNISSDTAARTPFTTIYSTCDTLFGGQLIGTGTVLCDGNLTVKLDKNYGALALLSTDDLNIDVSPGESEKIHFYGLLYSQDDVIIEPETRNAINTESSIFRPNMGVSIYSGDMNKTDDFNFGSGNPVSVKMQLPGKDVCFSNYNGYTRLLEETTGYNYSFPVKVKCYYEM